MTAPEAIRSQILALVKEYHAAKFAPETLSPQNDKNKNLTPKLIHYAGRVFDAEEIVNLVDASLDFYLTANRYAERFESEFADYLGLANALLGLGVLKVALHRAKGTPLPEEWAAHEEFEIR